MAAQFGRRLRRGAATTAVAAVAMAALTASQAPDLLVDDRGRAAGSPSDDHPIDGGSPYHTDLPPLQTPGDPDASIDLPGLGGDVESGIPATVLAAYKKAEAALADSDPGCNLPWELLAAIGKVESGQARGGAVDAEGTTLKPILGPQLNGNGFASIRDTDGGLYDNDTAYDRAVGPMQFIPSTWARWGADGNNDGAKDPNNIYDAALGAGRYLCAGGRDLSKKADLDEAILGYNHSREYLNTVLSWLEFYRKGTHEVPDGTGVLPNTPGAGGDPSGGGGEKGSSGKGGSGPKGKGKGPQDVIMDPEGPTASIGGQIEPTSGSSSGPGKPRPTKTGDRPTDEPTGGESEPGDPSPTGSECPSGSASPSESADDSASPTPSPSESSGSPDDGEPTESPCGEDEDGAGEDGGAEAEEPQPEPTSSGTAIGAAAARLT
ncbi:MULTISPECIES: lytic transglycosylase domain-containing protein [Streptomyces]|uniref:Lytic transglycosylase domain-containing protein n=1 Tax=Streptomyces lycii TaxID=2654337 RepID=A0ABQ7FG34_9ACTN|nr:MULTISPECIES: lytic transglycosylase domain-containing protein [Streptomyces]KAF4407270.1 lytic transglycosylase domain-containing protein [Streptomyces lycii]PGH50903.1 hypothetical protein CRI70_09595 [Streptomyces sp. Ru87]